MTEATVVQLVGILVGSVTGTVILVELFRYMSRGNGGNRPTQ